MLNSISVKNYKAFDEGSINIKPITILLGANNVGKSSILQLFLMLQQTALCDTNYRSALKLSGGFVSLGEGINLLRKKDKNKALTIGFDFVNQNLYDQLKFKLFNKYVEEVALFAAMTSSLFTSDRKLNNLANIFSKNTLFRPDLQKEEFSKYSERKEFISLLEETKKIINKGGIQSIFKNKDDLYFFYRYTHDHIKLLGDSLEEYLITFDFLKSISNIVTDTHFRVEYEMSLKDLVLYMKRMVIFINSKRVVSVDLDNQPIKIYSDLIDFSKLQSSNRKFTSSLNHIFVNPKTIFSFIVNPENNNESRLSLFAHYLNIILNDVNTSMKNAFHDDKINYVSPLRAHPKRYYFLDKAKTNLYVDTLDGDAITEVLKENSGLRNQVNEWFKKFNIKIDVNQMQDIIHKLVVNQNTLSLDITDVGFGISQILPVIIQGFLSHQKSITLIEQPEIHLHPKMQAELADLFIDIATEKDRRHNDKVRANRFLIIETHSEYLLKRLRRRISEGIIPPELVAIYLISPQNEEHAATIKELVIEDKGHFEWPTDFYGGELLKDTTEFIRNQHSIIA